MKILLAEDSLTNRLLIKAYAEKMGHSIVAVNDGQQAVDAFMADIPDLVIMDVEMPIMNGIEAAIAIRKFRTDNNIDWVPLIFLSGMTEAKDIAIGLEAGGDDYLTKPVNVGLLNSKLATMQRIVDLKQQLHTAHYELNLIRSKHS